MPYGRVQDPINQEKLFLNLLNLCKSKFLLRNQTHIPSLQQPASETLKFGLHQTLHVPLRAATNCCKSSTHRFRFLTQIKDCPLVTYTVMSASSFTNLQRQGIQPPYTSISTAWAIHLLSHCSKNLHMPHVLESTLYYIIKIYISYFN